MKLLCLDSNSILNRAFYGIKLLSTKDGVYTNAIFGYMNIFKKLLDDCLLYTSLRVHRRAPQTGYEQYDTGLFKRFGLYAHSVFGIAEFCAAGGGHAHAHGEPGHPHL